MNNNQADSGVMGRVLASPSSEHNFVLEPGQLLQRDLTVVEVIKFIHGQCVLRNVETLEEKFMPLERLYEAYTNRQLIPYSQRAKAAVESFPYEGSEFGLLMDDLSPATKLHARSLYLYITGLRAIGYRSLRRSPLLQLDFDRLKYRLRSQGHELVDLALHTVYKWSLEYDKQNSDPRALLPAYSKRGGRGAGRRLSDEVRKIADSVLTTLESNARAKIRTNQVAEAIEQQLIERLPLADAQLSKPSWTTVDRLIKERFSSYEICARNRGRAFANKKYRFHYPRDRAVMPLEIVEFDDKDTRTFLIDDLTGLPMGRGFLTAGVDQFSTRCLGLSVSHKHRSTTSALEAVRATLLPKGPALLELGLLGIESDPFGNPGVTLFDNALYFHANALEMAIQQSSNSIVAWAKPYTPTEKSCVEFFNRETVEHLLQELPGFGGPKIDKEQLSAGLASATLDLSTFKQCVYQWAFKVHPNKPRGDGKTPSQKWDEKMQFHRPRLPSNLDQFDAYFALENSLTLRPDGILYLGIPYQSDRLMMLRRRLGDREKVFFRFRECDLSRIFVRDPYEMRYFTVESANPEYTTRLSLYQHKLIRKLAAEKKKFNPNITALLAQKSELRKMVEQARLSKKRHERSWALRVGDVETPTDVKSKKNESISEVEYQVSQIQEVELSLADENWDLPEDF